jgi:hypothetical protein
MKVIKNNKKIVAVSLFLFYHTFLYAASLFTN